MVMAGAHLVTPNKCDAVHAYGSLPGVDAIQGGETFDLKDLVQEVEEVQQAATV